jgi:hypothetical protein
MSIARLTVELNSLKFKLTHYRIFIHLDRSEVPSTMVTDRKI